MTTRERKKLFNVMLCYVLCCIYVHKYTYWYSLIYLQAT